MRTAISIACFILLAGCEKPNTADSSAPASAPPASQITLDPAQTFAQSCARCHGPGGMFYAQPFQHQGDDLRDIIRSMMMGQAGLHPTDADVQAMYEYHLRMRDHLQSGTPNTNDE